MKTNKNSVRRSLIVSATALVLTVAMLIGTTFAWFTDSVTSGRNKIQAGNLDVELEYSKDFNTWNTVTENAKLFEDSETWEPGHTDVVYLRVSNAGTLALDYTLAMNIVKEVGSTNVNDKPFKLSQYIKYGVKEVSAAYADRKAAVNDVDATATNIATGTLKAEQLLKNQTKTFALVVYMPGETTGNEANHKTSEAAPYIELGIDLRAVQSQHEEDSFGNTYDATADGNPDHPEWEYTGNTTADVTVSANKDGDTVLTNANNTVTATVPKEALAEDTDNVQLTVTPTSKDAGNVTISAGETAQAYNVEVTGIKSNNDTTITVKLFIGKGLQNVTAYHNADALQDANYDKKTGYITFKTTSFSPFTFVYDQPQAINTTTDTYTYSLASDMGNVAEGETASWQLLADLSVKAFSQFGNKDSNAILDLNGHTLTLTTGNTIEVANGASFTLKNGQFKANNFSSAYRAVIKCNSLSSFTFENVIAETTASMLFPAKDAAYARVIDSTIKAGGYGIGTNAGSGNALNVQIDVRNSTITTHTEDGDNTAIYMNVVGTLNIENSVITGDRQGMFVRGGSAIIKDSTIATTGQFSDDKTYLEGAWKSGNELPCGALIVGNRETGNSYPANISCILKNTELKSNNGVRTIYLYAKNGANTQKVNFEYDSSSVIGKIEPDQLPDGITVNDNTISSTTE